MAVAPHHQRRRAGQGDAGRARFAPLAVRTDDRGAVPDVGDADPQVHVVGEQGVAVGGVGAVDRPVVAAGRRGEAVLLAARRRGEARRSGGGGRRALAQVVDLGPGDRRGRERLADHRRVPLRAARRQEVEEGRREQVVHQAEVRLAAPRGIVELEEHGEDGEDRILRPPRRRRAAQRQVLERRRAERREARVDAVGVGLDQRPLLGRNARHHLPGDGAEAVDAVRPVDRQRARAEDLGELAGGLAAHQVHLEEALLAVQEAEGAGGVGAARGPDRRHAEGVALDGDRRREAGQGALAGDLRQAGAHPCPQPQAPRGEGDEEQDEEEGDDLGEGSDPPPARQRGGHLGCGG